MSVHPPWDRQPHQLHFRPAFLAGDGVDAAEHHAADLHAPNPSGAVQFHDEGLSRELPLRDLRQQAFGVDEDGVSAGRLHHRQPCLLQLPEQVRRLADAVFQVPLVQTFLQPHGQRLQISPGEASVSHESLPQDQFRGDSLEQRLIPQADESADVDDGIFLGAHQESVRLVESGAGDLRHAHPFRRWIALFDEIAVLGVAGGVQHQWNPVAAQEFLRLPDVLQGDRLPAAGVVGDGEDHQGYPIRSLFFYESFQFLQIDVPFERVMAVRVEPFIDHQVDGLGTPNLHVGSGSVEMLVRRDDVPFGQAHG